MSLLQAWHEAAYGVSATTLYDPATESAIFFARLETFRTSTSPANYPSRSWGELIGFVDGQLKFLIVEATMTMERTSPNAVKDEVLPVVNELLGSFEKPDSAASVFMAGYSWVWYATNDALLSGMITGLAIAFPVAFGTLIFATQNVVIALYAILTIAMIVISVLGSAALEGWGLGIAESIAAVIVVGFSVDYTIHLGHMYDHGGRHEGCVTSVERARYAMLKMGNTVLAGAVTTCGSGVFMFACQLSFFNKMAFLICNTIAFSLLYALFFFMPLLFLVGPSGSSGHISNFLPGLGSASS
jgi:predicted RND superfamily exporter protein